MSDDKARTNDATTALTRDQTFALATDLVRALAPHAGDRTAVGATLRQWLDVLDVRDLSLVCMAVVHLIFSDCLSHVPTQDLPSDALTLTPPEHDERTAA